MEKKQDWFYSERVKKHFFSPKNFVDRKEEVKDYNGYGRVGNAKCGDIMEMWVLVKGGKIKKCRWRTFGCASAIASTSVLSEMVTRNGGMKVGDALNIKPKDIADELGELPAIKFHCSVLGDQALREAIRDYRKRNK